MSEERQRVLRMLKTGKITVEEAEALIRALEEAEGEVGGYSEDAVHVGVPADETAAEVPGQAAQIPTAGSGREQSAGSSQAAGVAPGDEDLAGEFRRLIDEIVSSVDVDEIVRSVRGSVETIRESLEKSRFDAGRVRAEVRRAARRAREETRKAARECGRHGLGMSISRAIDGLWGMEEVGGSWSYDGELPAGKTLVIRNTWGDVKLNPSPDALLHARASKRAWGRDEGDAAATLDQLRVTARWEGGAFEIRAHPPATRRTRVDFDIQVPSGVEVDLSQVRGDVEAEGLSGSLVVHTTSGDVKARDQSGSLRVESIRGDVEAMRVGGEVRIRSKRGDITLGEVGGPAEIDSLSGDVSTSRVAGDLTVRTLRGDIRTEACRGTIFARTKRGDIAVRRPTGALALDLSTASGDVEAEVGRLSADAGSVLSTMSGDITVRLGPDAGCSLTARVVSGEIHTGVPLREARQDRRSLQAAYGSGGARLTLSTVSGDITLAGYSSPASE